MFLAETNLADYLVGRGSLSSAAVVLDDFMVVDASARNRNFKVLRGDQNGLFVKQIRSSDALSIATLEREANCYRWAQADARFASLARLMPKFIDYDTTRYVLIVELLPAAENVNLRHRRLKQFPLPVATLIGEALGSYHAEAGGLFAGLAPPGAFPGQVPWVLSLHLTPDPSSSGLNAGNSQLVEIVRRYPVFPSLLDQLRNNWRRDGLIHGDIKWDNCVLCGFDAERPELRVVDWELADVGDVAWDVGGVLQAFLCAWILSLPPSPDVPSTQTMSQASYPLEAMQPAIGEFWRSYSVTRKLDSTSAAETLVRATQYGAARMVQTAFEYTQFAGQFTTPMAALLQVSMNVLQTPRDAIRDLFAIAI